MGIPWRLMTLAAVGASYYLTPRASSWVAARFFGNFIAAWAFQFLLFAIWKVILYPKVFSPLRGLPEPGNNSFFNGQFPRILAEPSGNPMKEWINTIPNNGVIRYLGLLNQERVLVTSPKALSDVLVTKNYDFPKPADMRYTIGRILGIGILLAEGDEHKKQRKNLSPAFSFRHVKDLYPIFWSKSRECVEAMTEQVSRDGPSPSESGEKTDKTLAADDDAAVVDVGNWASRVTLDIIGVCGLGRDFGAIKDPNTELNQTYTRVMKPSKTGQILSLMTMFVPGWIVNRIPIKRNDDILQAAGFIRDTCRDLIRSKRAKLANKEPSDLDILSAAIESGGFTDENLVDQLMTFLAAGHETTASAMTWAIYMLCLHPEMQDRLRAEIRERLPSISDPSATVSSVDIDHMPYLNAFCSEVLRYWSPAPMTVREAARDTTIAGHAVPKGTRVMLVPWAVNKSTELWGDDALRFNPDRWLVRQEDGGSVSEKASTSGGASSNYAFLTFLHGPRSCIGMGFARGEMACILASWVGRFEFELKNEEERDEDKLDIRTGITAQPRNGLSVKTRVVEGW